MFSSVSKNTLIKTPNGNIRAGSLKKGDIVLTKIGDSIQTTAITNVKTESVRSDFYALDTKNTKSCHLCGEQTIDNRKVKDLKKGDTVLICVNNAIQADVITYFSDFKHLSINVSIETELSGNILTSNGLVIDCDLREIENGDFGKIRLGTCKVVGRNR